MKDMQNLYVEMYKNLLKDIEEYLNNCPYLFDMRHIMFTDKKTQHYKDSDYNYKSNAISIKISIIFHQTRQADSIRNMEE